MKVFIVYCHPSEDSFTRNIRDAFIKGITDSGNEYIISDLYKIRSIYRYAFRYIWIIFAGNIFNRRCVHG